MQVRSFCMGGAGKGVVEKKRNVQQEKIRTRTIKGRILKEVRPLATLDEKTTGVEQLKGRKGGDESVQVG